MASNVVSQQQQQQRHRQQEAQKPTGNKTTYLADYQPPPYLIDAVELVFELDRHATRVSSTLSVRRNPGAAAASDAEARPPPLVLDTDKGVQLVPGSLAIDGAALSDAEYELTPMALTIHRPPPLSPPSSASVVAAASRAAFTVQSTVQLDPAGNKALEGLYMSGGNFCTQCEAEGFRRITFFPDRPDVMARYSTKIIADKEAFPVLLSNGNLVERGDHDAQRHYVVYEDPWRKPSYLFALVAGDLVAYRDTFSRASDGQPVELCMYVRRGDEGRCAHAMDSLKRAMKWDEEVYGREYDLHVFNVVAVNDFNMGAMENKSLNVFNSKYVLASAATATDSDFNAIEGVVAHEYFHNWSGNRVTCRDWFQLSLKEGLTVFRDQEFSADMLKSRAVKRIKDVMRLRAAQFPQDAGPMAHPVRPHSYESINNFYSVTVYEKGAEVIRMMRTLLGVDGFRRGTDLYFARHDGHAVTCDDFVAAMRDANPDSWMDESAWTQFKLWYSQAGTPHVRVSVRHDDASREMRLIVRQSVPPTPGQPEKRPQLIPIAAGVIGPDGGEVLPTRVLRLTEEEQEFVLGKVALGSVASLLRGFSAPVKLTRDMSAGEEQRERAFLMVHDTDDFCRWEAAQSLVLEMMLSEVRDGSSDHLRETVLSAFEQAFDATVESDPLLLAQLMTLPSEGYVADQLEAGTVDPVLVHRACAGVKRMLARRLAPRLEQCLHRTTNGGGAGANGANDSDGDSDAGDAGAFSISAAAQGARAIANTAVDYLTTLGDERYLSAALARVRRAETMTSALGALHALAGIDARDSAHRRQALSEFYDKWSDDYLVVDKWLRIQAMAPRSDAFADVQRLVRHPAYDAGNPNNVYAVLGGFAIGNPYGFHGSEHFSAAYRFVAEQVLALDRGNPQVAARIAGAFVKWRRYEATRRMAMQHEMRRVLHAPELSPDVREIMAKSLNEGVQ